MKTTHRLVKIPTRFLIDHDERALPTPDIVMSNKAFTQAWICQDDTAFCELVNDAEYYADPAGPRTVDSGPCKIHNAAIALLKALQRQGAYDGKFRLE